MQRTRLILVVLLLATACASAPPSSSPLFVAENVDHVALITVLRPDASSRQIEDSARIEAEVEEMRRAPGNLAVYVLRRKVDGATETAILSEWASSEQAAACHLAGCGFAEVGGTRRFDVLFEATQFQSR